MLRRLARLIPLALLAALWPAVGPPGAAAATRDWRTYGFSSTRVGLNPTEHALGPAQARGLRQLWAVNLGGVIPTQPLVAFGVRLPSGMNGDLVYAGTSFGRFAAVDAATGQVVWSRQLGSIHIAECQATKGVTDTPVLDRGRGSIYVVGGTGKAFELDLATGATKHTWTITTIPKSEHVWSALTLVRGRLYIPVAGICDIPPFKGRVVAIDTATRRRVATWYVTGRNGPDGGGIWAWGGVSADRDRNALFTATGNSFPPPSEHVGNAEHVVRLTTDLEVRASHYPGVRGFDADFGATPLLYEASGCPRQLAVGNKYGEFFVYNRGRMGDGPVQHIALGGSGDGGHALLGVAAYWAAKRMVYVANPVARGRYKPGIVAFRVTSGCRLALAWQAQGPGRLTSSPSLANGVLYYGTGADARLMALDATTGEPLWNSGGAVGDSIYNAPSVTGGAVYAGSWDGRLYAFGPTAVRRSR